jgi:hypothetical protein
VIADKFVDLHARSSGLRDKLIAERDVVLTYALRALLDAGVMDHLAFKGGTCLRKLVFGSSGRFSEALDFTLDTDRPDDDVLTEIVEVFNHEHHGITFTFDAGLLRRLAVLKLWQARDPFDPEAFFTKLHSGVYDWDEIRRLVRASERIEPGEILASVEGRLAAFRQLTGLEEQVIADAKRGWNEPLAERLRSEIRELAAGEAS